MLKFIDKEVKIKGFLTTADVLRDADERVYL